MMVIFVSQCEKKALSRTRRVLDSFADRIGDNTWQTVITEDGLIAVKRMLRKTASKSTAVSCHWIRGRSRSELLWVVGNRNKFDNRGCVAVNSTKKINKIEESKWDYLPLIRALVALTSLFHDWGKATNVFQEKLNPDYKGNVGDPIRHEWISCVLLDAFIRNCISNNTDWLSELAEGNIDEDHLTASITKKPENIFSNHDSIALSLMWLIISHHRLPLPLGRKEDLHHYKEITAKTIEDCLKQITVSWGYENRRDEIDFSRRLSDCFKFSKGLMTDSNIWIKDIKRWASKMILLKPQIEQLFNNNVIRLILQHARLCLMLGDHYYSSKAEDSKWQGPSQLYANTDRKTRKLKQKLDEHLVGVKKHALEIVNLLPKIQQFDNEEATAVYDNKALKKTSTGSYLWQQKTVNQIISFKKKQLVEGAFIVNMASTGCGKTFANAKIMQALSVQSKSIRFVLALGLRSLTLQTGDEYRERVGLRDDELAVLIGSKAVIELHNSSKTISDSEDSISANEYIGSESLELLMEEDVDYTGILPDDQLSTVLTDENARKFLYAPVLACTIDHLMGATETKRGGRYILPSLRLLSSDLIIDEVDDFYGEDLAAIGRLVYLAGLLGRKVMISSATIPPALAEGFFNAYRSGWCLFCLTQQKSSDICSIWVDEFNCDIERITSAEKGVKEYQLYHEKFIDKRISKLQKQLARRKARIIECKLFPSDESDNYSKKTRYFDYIWQTILSSHLYHNTLDIVSQKKVSFGVVRVANIGPCVDLTRYLLDINLPTDTDIRVMAYHSQQVLLMRHEQELHLDSVLKRKEKEGESPKVFSHPLIRYHLQHSSATNMIFILVATPVEEVGRDHDFDWAVVEPSSYRSIIQLAGRVRRHRSGEVFHPNVNIMQYNWKAFEKNDREGIYFSKPGYEDAMSQPLPFHNMDSLIEVEQIEKCLDASARLKVPISKEKKHLFSAIEHKATKDLLIAYDNVLVSNLQGYLQHSWWLTALPQTFQSFRRSTPVIQLYYVWDEKKQRFYWAEKDEDGNPVNREQQRNIKTNDYDQKNMRLWMNRDYLDLLEKLLNDESSIRKLSLRYGELCLTINNESDQFEYNPQLGVYRIK